MKTRTLVRVGIFVIVALLLFVIGALVCRFTGQMGVPEPKVQLSVPPQVSTKDPVSKASAAEELPAEVEQPAVSQPAELNKPVVVESPAEKSEVKIDSTAEVEQATAEEQHVPVLLQPKQIVSGLDVSPDWKNEAAPFQKILAPSELGARALESFAAEGAAIGKNDLLYVFSSDSGILQLWDGDKLLREYSSGEKGFDAVVIVGRDQLEFSMRIIGVGWNDEKENFNTWPVILAIPTQFDTKEEALSTLADLMQDDPKPQWVIMSSEEVLKNPSLP